ncbi:uncharacterized [Tachysurus ichikawai]
MMASWNQNMPDEENRFPSASVLKDLLDDCRQPAQRWHFVACSHHSALLQSAKRSAVTLLGYLCSATRPRYLWRPCTWQHINETLS